MRIWKRVAISASAMVVVGAAALAVRDMMLGGVFDAVQSVPLACEAIPGVVGAEDIAIDAKSGLLFASAADRRHPGAGSDGIYMLRLADPKAGFTKLGGAPSQFHPHGISLFRGADGALTLMAVNHMAADRHAVDIFGVSVKDGTAAMTEIGDIQSDKLVHPNDIAAVGPAQFYVTNDHGSRTALGAQAEDYLTLPRADVLYYDGMVFKEAASGLVLANGIAVSREGGLVYVAETTMRRIRTFSRDAFSGRLTPHDTFALPTAPDNIDVAADGALWVAGHPKLFGLLAYMGDASKPSPAQILRVATAGGMPRSARVVYADAGGREIAAASVGAAAGKTLFIGAIFDAKVLACRLP